jgi:hypothetical protein
MTPTELWLPIGAAAFYLYDSCSLLWQNELVFTRGRRWLVQGGTELRLAGRRVFLPNPLLPMRPQFQVQWNVSESRTQEAASPAALLQALRPIGILNQLQLLILLALPLVSWTEGAGLVMLAMFLLFYICTLLALTLAWRRRVACSLSTRHFWLIVLDAVACAPFAVNLVRKISMRHGIAGDPLRFAARNLDPAACDELRQMVAARVREEHPEAEPVELERRIGQLLSRLE